MNFKLHLKMEVMMFFAVLTPVIVICSCYFCVAHFVDMLSCPVHLYCLMERIQLCCIFSAMVMDVALPLQIVICRTYLRFCHQILPIVLDDQIKYAPLFFN